MSTRSAWLPLLLLLVVPAWARSADGEPTAGRFRDHLEAGEFGLAREAALAAGDAAERDTLLAELARREMHGGAPTSAWRSLSEISDDRRRTSAIDSLAAPSSRGGAALADFDTLIELITATVAPNSWEEAGGVGAIEEFPTGVYVDARGVLRTVSSDAVSLEALRRRSLSATGNADVRKPSPLRKVSLNRLEREVQRAWLAGRSPDETMRHLAGIRRIQYVFIYPESGDIVIAGPAGGWDSASGAIGDTAILSEPVLHLDDLVVLLRHARQSAGPFGCAIKPRRENLERAQKLLADSSGRPLKPGQRGEWLRKLQEALGRQDIEVFGIDPRTRVARVLVEADYQMKLIGIGRDEATLGVTSYMDLAAADPEGASDLSVLRWWFAMNYDAVKATSQRDGFSLEGQAVKLLSENELLTERGERIHTGRSDEKNSAFAASFTKHFEALASKYPVFTELRNVFDLALVAALVEEYRLADQASWHATHFLDPQRYEVELRTPPTEVDSVVHHRATGRGRFIAAAAGGVHADVAQWIAPNRVRADDEGTVVHSRGYAAVPDALDPHRWWWD